MIIMKICQLAYFAKLEFHQMKNTFFIKATSKTSQQKQQHTTIKESPSPLDFKFISNVQLIATSKNKSR